jgi:DNA-binding transcriptional ArsR family regulator
VIILAYKVEFEFSPLYELVTSLDLFLSKKFIKNVDIGTDWVKNIQMVLDNKNIQLGNPKDIPCFDYLYLLIWQSPEKENLHTFVKWLGSLDPGQLYEKLFSYLLGPVPADLITIRNKYMDLLIKWHEIYFEHIDKRIMETLQHSVKEWQAQSDECNSVMFVEKVSGGVRLEEYEGLHQVLLTPTYHISPLLTIRKNKYMVHIFYPVDLPVQDTNQPSKKLVRLTKALADENRLRILKLVKEGAKTFTEIQQQFDVSKSTVHHHLMLLRTAGLISVYHSSESCSDSYIYRELGIDELSQYLNVYIEK